MTRVESGIMPIKINAIPDSNGPLAGAPRFGPNGGEVMHIEHQKDFGGEKIVVVGVEDPQEGTIDFRPMDETDLKPFIDQELGI